MTTLLFGSERGPIDTPPLPMNAPASRGSAGDDQVAVADTELMPVRPLPATQWDDAQPSVPPVMKRAFPALPAMTRGLMSTAALFVGLALFVIAVAFPMSDIAHYTLMMIAIWLMAAAIAFTLSYKPEYA